MLFNKLSQEDKDTILYYITRYANNGDKPSASLEELLRFWDSHKERLYHLFGDKFILSRPVEYNKPAEDIIDDVRDVINSDNGAFVRLYKDKISKLYNDEIIDWPLENALMELAHADNLAKGKFDHETEVYNLDGKKIVIQKGCKPMKMLGKFAKEWNLTESFEKFRIAVSMTTNQRKIKGELCLSIHPLDYMTMSDNNENWSSCMSWMEDGCYKRGTVEMMNSDNVVVAYLKSDKKTDLGSSYNWNSKKWRTLVIADPRALVSIKAYPYQNYDLAGEALDWLNELSNNEYMDTKDFNPDNVFDYFGREVNFDADTEAMYNDFGTGVRHLGKMSKEFFNNEEGKTIKLHIYYSGESECMNCGSCNEYFESEGNLLCDACDEHIVCDCCGEYMNPGDEYTLDDVTLCQYCYEEHCVIDDITGDEHYDDNMTTVYILPNGAEELEKTSDLPKDYHDYPSFMTYQDIAQGYDHPRVLKSYFVTDCIFKIMNRSEWSTIRYVTVGDINPDYVGEFTQYSDMEELLEDVV